MGRRTAQWLAYLRPDPSFLGSNHSSRGLLGNISDVAVYQHTTYTVDNEKSLIMLIKRIQYWLVAH